MATEEEIRPGIAGRVKLDGKIWTAKSAGDDIIPVGAQVMVTDIKGVTLTVVKN